MTRDTRRQAAAQRIGGVLPEVLRMAQQRHTALDELRRAWGKAVGKPLAAHSKPVSLRHGRLVVHVEHPGDSFALNYAREQLKARLQRATKTPIDDIVFRAGDVA